MHGIFNYIVNISNLVFIFAIAGFSCNSKSQKQKISLSGDSIVFYADRFTLQRTDSCTILTIIDPWQGAGGIIERYYLIKDRNINSLKVDPSHSIFVPIKSIICMSTTHVAMIKTLKEEDAIVAVSGADFIYDKDISGRIKDGLINDIGYEAGLNSELIIKSSPDLVMIYGVGSESAGYTAKIKELGIKVMYNADYLETDPLGKAEWIKVFGALFCREKMADSVFLEIAGSYNRVKEFIVRKTDSKPLVLLGLPFRDTWYVSPGNSYINKLIDDSGGKYLWENTESSVSMPYGLENVFIEALKADFWLNPGSVTSKNEIVSIDPRLGIVPPFINDRIYNNNKRVNESGGNDYWESGTLNPHIIIMDIASILHPEIFPDHQLVYYRKIE